jgi:hypothetical protein
MTPEQKAAFINAQSVMMYCELQEMIAANKEREQRGHSLAYPEDTFANLYASYNHVLGYNAVVKFFED